VVKLKF